MISVILPVHNAAPTLQRCIDSLLSQHYPDFELIIIDDGSTDDSLSLCEHYARKDVRISITHQTNQGVSQARNRGLELVRGEYVTFVDADDWVTPLHLEQLLQGMKQAQLSVVDMVMHRPDASTFSLHLPHSTSTSPADVVRAARLFGSTCNTMFLSNIIHQHNLRFDPRITQGEDTDFLMRYTAHIHAVTLSDAATYHYMMPDQTKSYATSNLLYTYTKLYENMLDLVQFLPHDQQQAILAEEIEEDLDWAIEGLFFYPSSEHTELPILLQKFSRYFYPHLLRSHRKSIRHQVFKYLCRSSHPKAIWIISQLVARLRKAGAKAYKRIDV